MSRTRSLTFGAAAMLVVSVSSVAPAETKSSAVSRLALFGQQAAGVCTLRQGLDGLYRDVGGQAYRCTQREAQWQNAQVNTPCVTRPGRKGDWREVISGGSARWARCGASAAGWLLPAAIAVGGGVFTVAASKSP